MCNVQYLKNFGLNIFCEISRKSFLFEKFVNVMEIIKKFPKGTNELSITLSHENETFNYKIARDLNVICHKSMKSSILEKFVSAMEIIKKLPEETNEMSIGLSQESESFSYRKEKV